MNILSSFSRLSQGFFKFGCYPNSEVKILSLIRKSQCEFEEVEVSGFYYNEIIEDIVGKYEDLEYYKTSKKRMVLKNGFYPIYITLLMDKMLYVNFQGKNHRYGDKPARISFSLSQKNIIRNNFSEVSTGNYIVHKDKFYSYQLESSWVEQVEFYKNGKYHRDGDSPAFENFCKVYKKYYKEGKLHRDNNKPSVLIYSTNNNLEIVEYYQNGKLHRKYLPDRIEYSGNKIIEEMYFEQGKLHREGKPAWIKYHSKRNNVIFKSYYKDGKLHREDKPAKIQNYFKGDKKRDCRINNSYRSLRYYQNGLLQRDNDKPAKTAFFLDNEGKVKSRKYEKYYQNGLLQRDNDKPAKILYSNIGKLEYISQEEYYTFGILNRSQNLLNNYPAQIVYFLNSNMVKFEKYFLYNILHREEGPAWVKYNRCGFKEFEKYYLNGRIDRRDNNPAAIRYFTEHHKECEDICEKYQGDIFVEKYYRFGVRWRLRDLPSIVQYFISEDGIRERVKFEIYLLDKTFHRVEGPTLIRYENNEIHSTEKEVFARDTLWGNNDNSSFNLLGDIKIKDFTFTYDYYNNTEFSCEDFIILDNYGSDIGKYLQGN